MSKSSMLGHYLRARRAATQPEDVGLPREADRRVAGLRRLEVAELAGISSEYYIRIEQGTANRPSDQVLDSIARALRLDEDAVAYMRRIAVLPHTPFCIEPPGVDSSLVSLLDQWTLNPAFVVDCNLDVVASNALADLIGNGAMSLGANRVLVVFSADADRSAPGWLELAEETVASLRMTGDPHNLRLQSIVGGLSVHDSDFRRIWAKYNVKKLKSGTVSFDVEPFGPIALNWQNLDVPGYANHTLTSFYAVPGTAAVDTLAFLAARLDVGAPQL